jgi:polyprenyl P-hydroxybenzoate/phenylacrylic acid decarboxylase-like protein
VGISGASGVLYGIRALQILKHCAFETHLIMTRSAQITLARGTSFKVAAINQLASVVHRIDDVGASISSGSFRTMGMLVAPCSVCTMSEIATNVTSSLLTRAADVALKERAYRGCAFRRRRDGHYRRQACIGRIAARSFGLGPSHAGHHHGSARGLDRA